MKRGRQFPRTGRFRARRASSITGNPQVAPQLGKPAPLPICTGGWNTIAALTAAPPDSAITLDNWFPQAAFIEVRKGSMEFCDTGVTNPVETIMPYHGVSTSADKIFAAAGTVIYDVTTGTASSAVTSMSNARWQFVQIATAGGNFLIAANGANAVRSYNGTSWATPTLTGVTSANIIDVTTHLNRLWFVEKNSTTAYFLPTASIAGTVRPFPLGGLFKLGGNLLTIASWKIDGEGGDNDLLVFLSTRGEAIVYAGTDPTNAATWARKGNYLLGTPIGQRPLVQVGGDLALICIDGVLPLSQAMLVERSAAVRISLTANIQPTMADSARRYSDHFGWQLIGYPRGTRMILNVPAVEADTQQQYVMNTVTGAWCRFRGMNGNCWSIWKDRIFFGSNDGRVMEGDVGGSDDGAAIEADLETAFHDLGNRGVLKHFSMVRPIFTASSAIVPGIGVNVDYETGAEVSSPSVATEAAALWDIAQWDVDTWPIEQRLIKNWRDIAAKPGNTISIRIKVTSQLAGSDEPTLQLNALDLIFQPGGILG